MILYRKRIQYKNKKKRYKKIYKNKMVRVIYREKRGGSIMTK
jgi:hypothetical protein